MAEDLIRLGCVPNKSLVLEWPIGIPDNVVSHFVRGYFDGDGCVGWHKRDKSVTVNFVGSHSFIASLSSYIKSNVLSSMKANGCHSNEERISRLVFGGNKSAMKVLDWVYKDSVKSMRLDRKYAMYNKLRKISNLQSGKKLKAMDKFYSSEEWKAVNECMQKGNCPHLRGHSRKLNKNYTPIIQINIKTQREIQTWQCASDIQSTLNYQAGYILRVCRGELQHAHGFGWRFVSDPSE